MPKPAKRKRGRPKKQRAGCLLCKPQKANGADRRTIQERRKDSRGKQRKGSGKN